MRFDRNPAMSDGKALFHADHSNLLTGAASALSIDSLSKAKTQMATQKAQVEKGKGRTLNIRPGFVLTPVALEDKANQIINSEPCRAPTSIAASSTRFAHSRR
ncbi:Mu-like prophage major head subunit gpT family protein [Pseudomonas aeruginosa]